MILQGLAAALAAALVFGGVQTWRLDSAQDTLSAERLARVEERSRMQDAALQAQADNAATTKALQDAVQKAEKYGQEDKARLQRVAAAARADAERVRDEFAAYAAGRGTAADDTVEACRARAAELGRAVADGVRVQERMAEAFGDLASDYRKMYVSWPASNKGKPLDD